jgi:hypothetical protein
MLGVLIVAPQAPSAATTNDQGAIIVRVPDNSTPICISSNNHKISFILRRVIVSKDAGLFKEDKEIGLLLDIQMAGNTGEDQKSQKFPRMFKTSIEEFEKGSVSLPIERVLFHGYKLKSDTTLTTQIETSFSILKKKKKAPFSVVLEQLVKVTSSLPIPPNPYVTAFNHFASYADEVITKSINEENNVSEELKGGNIAFAFSENGTCTGTLETTGTIAVIRASSGTENDGIINTTSDYCYSAQFTPVFELRFATMPVDHDCAKATNFRKVRNPYLGFVLNASVVGPRTLGGEAAEDADARKRCTTHGLPLETCM